LLHVQPSCLLSALACRGTCCLGRRDAQGLCRLFRLGRLARSIVTPEPSTSLALVCSHVFRPW
jgi:hypothetical protein